MQTRLDPPIYSLAIETMAIIVSHCRQIDLPALLITSKFINHVAVQAAYAVIQLTNDNIEAFVETTARITGTHTYPLFVRQLSIDLRSMSCKRSPLLPLLLALVKMIGLRHLTFMIEPPRIPMLTRYCYKLGLFATSQRHSRTPLPLLTSITVHETPDLYKLTRDRNIEYIASAEYLSPETLQTTINNLHYAWHSLTSVNLRLREHTSIEQCVESLCSSSKKLRKISLSQGHSSSMVRNSPTNDNKPMLTLSHKARPLRITRQCRTSPTYGNFYTKREMHNPTYIRKRLPSINCEADCRH